MTDVFISYSRRDKVFTQKLVDALMAAKREVWADWASIPAASDWDAEIKEGIEKTNTVLFLLSPEWIKSNECRKEMVHAIQHGKRLIPILYLMPDQGQEVPPELAKINWVYMRDTDDFDKAFETLQSAMDTDLDWIKTHTRVQVRAIEWNKKNRDNSFTLRGKDLTDGEQFISGATGKSPEPTQLQGEYVLASRKDATRRQRITLAGVTIALVVSIALGITAWFQRQEAIAQARIALSRQLAAQAETINLTLNSKQNIALLLAAESAKLEPSLESARILANKKNTPKIFSRIELSSTARQPIFTPDGKYLTWNDNEGVHVWDVDAAKEIAAMSHDKNLVLTAISPDGKYLVTGSTPIGLNETSILSEDNCDNTANVWELTTGKKVASMANTGCIYAIQFSPDGRYVATASDNTARIWDIKSGKEIKSIFHDSTVKSIAFSPDGQYLLSTGEDLVIRMSDVSTGAEVWSDPDTPFASREAIFSSDGKYVLGSGFNMGIVLNSVDGSVVGYIIKENNPFISDIDFHPDGEHFLMANKDNTLGVYAINSVNANQDFVELFSLQLDAPVHRASFSKDGKYIITASWDGTARLWDFESHQEIARTTMEDQVLWAAISPDGKYVASSDSKRLYVWETKSGNDIKYMFHDFPVLDAKYSPDGKYIASASRDGTARIWDAATGEEIVRLVNGPTPDDTVDSFAFSPDGKYIFTAGWDGSTRMWEIATGKEIWKAETSLLPVWDAAFSPDGKYVASGGTDHTFRVFDAKTGKEILNIEAPNIQVKVLFTKDGKYLITGGSDYLVIVCEIATGKFINMFNNTDQVNDFELSPDEKYLITGGEDYNARIWKLDFGKDLNLGKGDEFIKVHHNGPVNTVTFSPDGTLAASGSGGDDDVVIVWETSTGKEITRIQHLDDVNSVAFSPDGKYIVTGSSDHTAHIVEIATGNEEMRVTHSDVVNKARFSPDGNYVLTASADYSLRITPWGLDALTANACKNLPRNLTKEEWNTYIGSSTQYTAICPDLPTDIGSDMEVVATRTMAVAPTPPDEVGFNVIWTPVPDFHGPTPTITPNVQWPEGVIYQDDFSASSQVYELYEDEYSSSSIENGVYTLRELKSGYWLQNLGFIESADSEITAQINPIPGEAPTIQGVMCRASKNEVGIVTGYLFYITNDGYAGIIKFNDNGVSELATGKPFSQSASNTISASCAGDTLTWTVNGKKIAEVADKDFSTGNFGFTLYVPGDSAPQMQVEFDNLVIRKPGSGSSDSVNSEPVVAASTSTPAPTAKAESDILYQDDFSTTNAALENYTGNEATVGVSNGVFSLTNKSNYWWISPIPVPASDSMASVQLRQVAGPANNNTGFGLMCRYGVNESGFHTGYLFAISGDGYASIQIVTPDGTAPLVDWATSNLVNQADSGNLLSVSCVGNQLTLSVNGQPVIEVTDSTFANGDFAFTAISFEKDSLEVQVEFDDLLITQP